MGLLKKFRKSFFAWLGFPVPGKKKRAGKVKSRRKISKVLGIKRPDKCAPARGKTSRISLRKTQTPVTRPSRVLQLSPSKKKKVANLSKLQPQSFYIGKVTHFFPKAGAAAVRIERKGVALGDCLQFQTQAPFTMTLGSLQIDRNPVEKAKIGQEVGIRTLKPVQPGDEVFKLVLND